ncbi:MAG: diheme cytochrome c [Mariprofundaceae bacterium]|nr:diheme cytochrome c [Mariprofundaceae bacterium]
MNIRILAGTVVMAAAVTLSVSGIAFADRDDDDRGIFKRTATVPAVTSKLYAAECGSCHFAYQPGWLPARSWKKMMGTLDQHFGENAELGQQSGDAITRYLVAESADVRPNRKSRKILRSIGPDETPLRISTLRYMLNKHDEIPKRFIEGNPKVGSRANCAACHSEASNGYFNEHGVNIPGHGPWED